MRPTSREKHFARSAKKEDARRRPRGAPVKQTPYPPRWRVSRRPVEARGRLEVTPVAPAIVTIGTDGPGRAHGSLFWPVIPHGTTVALAATMRTNERRLHSRFLAALLTPPA